MIEQVSCLIPFRDDNAEGRLANFEWLLSFWRHELPNAEIVIGEDQGSPFSKTCALNNAFKQSHGDIIVLLDADCYIDPVVITQCAYRIRKARREGDPLWFVPYRHLYRLTKEATAHLLASDPAAAWRFPVPPKVFDCGDMHGSGVGHWFGALIQIMPREAFEVTGGMDPVFRGWGGEDVTFLRILDTLYTHHRTSGNQVIALWHPQHGDALLRMWDGQPRTGINNARSMLYRKFYRDKKRTLDITQKWQADPQYADNVIRGV
jgi:glycosyltransferase involved in cell wall biosynthesis